MKTGQKVWQQDLLKLAGSDCPRHGYCGSPLVAGDRVYVEPGGAKGKSVAVESGEELQKGPYMAETFPVHVEDAYVIVDA